jgi:glycopeptide antibiotics resistance protein
VNKVSRVIRWYQFYLEKISLKWYFILMLLGVISVVFLLRMHLTRKRKIIFWLAIEYCFLVLASTVFSRSRNMGYGYSLNPLGFMNKIYNGNIDDRYEVYMNILMLIPIGTLLAVIYKKVTCVMICLFFSLIIEILQLIFHRGSFEISDLIMNTMGGLFGCIIYSVWSFILKIFYYTKQQK